MSRWIMYDENMDLDELKLTNLGVDKSSLGRIFSFVDFGNVNHWFDKYRGEFNGVILEKDEKLMISIEKLGKFIDLFSERKLFYYGLDIKSPSSIHIKVLAEKIASFTPVSKPIQWIKHYLSNEEMEGITQVDPGNKALIDGYILIPKCNFDVEIAVDAIRLADKYDTFALFSSDNDFRALLDYLKKLKKKIIFFHSGPTSAGLRDGADLKVTGPQIRETVCSVKPQYKIPPFGRNF